MASSLLGLSYTARKESSLISLRSLLPNARFRVSPGTSAQVAPRKPPLVLISSSAGPAFFHLLLPISASRPLLFTVLNTRKVILLVARPSFGPLVFVNEISLRLHGMFLHDPTTQATPVYLFVPPIPVKHINGMHCVCYPPPNRLFHWSLRSDGKDVTPEDWEKYGVPKLKMQIRILYHFEPGTCRKFSAILRVRRVPGPKFSGPMKNYFRQTGLRRVTLRDIWVQQQVGSNGKTEFCGVA
ncbi:hypothetical protein PM082_023331 [Marasmius tenuissimus]|nr:hypothetical protein PM082_023331 [Marasmius tenuissimus]